MTRSAHTYDRKLKPIFVVEVYYIFHFRSVEKITNLSNDDVPNAKL